jgi:hypothetical protein
MMANITNCTILNPLVVPLCFPQTSSMTISPLENQFDNAHSDTSTAFSVYHTTFLWVEGVLHATAYARDDRLAACRTGQAESKIIRKRCQLGDGS